MRYTNQFGIAAPELGWVPSPSYILRRAAILDCLKTFPPGRVLEMGCGAGALLYEISKLGFYGEGVEVSSHACELAKKILVNVHGISIIEDLPKESYEMYDYLLTFEVIEHIEDDIAAMKQWKDYLKPGGLVILSVPAHKKKWNVTDLLAGHYRRYDKKDIISLVDRTGFELIQTITCGWPVSWFIERLRLISRKVKIKRSGIHPSELCEGDFERTIQSGMDRNLETKLFSIYGSWIGQMLFFLAISIQRIFYSTELGISFIVIAKKPKVVSSDCVI